MGKVFNSMIMGVIITAVLLLMNGSGFTATSLFLLVLNPTSWQNSGFWLIFSSLFTVTGFIVIGLAAIIKQDWVLRAGAIISLSSVVVAPFVDFYQFIVSQTTYLSLNCVNSPVCSQLNQIGGIGQIVALLLAGPMIIYSAWACLEWIYTGDKF